MARITFCQARSNPAPFCLVAFFLAAATVTLSAQVAPLAPKWLAGTPPPPVETFADALTRHHIDLTESALIAALQNPDGDIRSLAAAQLAAMDDRQALKPILEAMESESDLQVQVNLAGAATWLSSNRALDQLQRLCQNTNVPDATRLDAARYVSHKELSTCYSSVEEIAQRSNDPNIRILALQTAATYRGQADKANALLVSALSDRDPAVRVAAADTLRLEKVASAIDALARALPLEGDAVTRDHLREAIRALQASSSAH